MRACWLVAASLIATTAWPSRPAAADSDDLVLSRLATRVSDGSGGLTAVIPDQLAFRALASQLGVVLAPQLLTPADTIGFGGFELVADTTVTSIDSSAPYWRALAGSPDPAGTTATSGTSFGPGSMGTVGMFVRKGMWLPVPSFEVGVGAVHLLDSSIWCGQLYTKLALYEGYHQLPLPSLAVRGGVSSMMNERELDLTVASLDVTVSKHIGIAGTWRLDPYLGLNYLWIIPRSGVLDATPNVASTNDSVTFVFPQQSNITRTRVFAGAKAQYGALVLTAELLFAASGASVDDVAGATANCTSPATTTKCNTPDTATSQTTFAVSAGAAF